jgi:hypothetical protein
MNAFHKILLWAIVVFAMLFVGIWLFNHVYAWFGVAFIAAAIYAAVRYAIHIINNLKK